jgi:hypothetical protein
MKSSAALRARHAILHSLGFRQIDFIYVQVGRARTRVQHATCSIEDNAQHAGRT